MTTTKQRQPNAATVSATLRKAGFDKAGEYQPFARQAPGFIVGWMGSGEAAYVIHTGSYNNYRNDADEITQKLTAYAETLRAAGYNVTLDQRQGNGAVTGLRIIRWQD